VDKAERQRIAERAAALDVWLANLPRHGHPEHGDPDIAERALEAFEERRPARDASDDHP
jgi:hypothetical protein